MRARRKTKTEIEEEIKDLDHDEAEEDQPDNAESVGSESSASRGRVKIPDAWSRVLKIDDRLKLPIQEYWVAADIQFQQALRD